MLIRGHPDFAADAVYIALELVIAALAVAGNVLVMWAVILNSNLQNVTNYFVASLAAADVAVGVLAVPFAVTVSTGFCASFYGCLFIACFVLVLTQSSIFSLLAIAIDRFIAIRMPLRYNALVTASRAKGIIAICWVLSFVIGLTPMLGWNRRPATGDAGNAASNVNISAANAASTNNCSANMVPCLFEGVVTMEYMVYYNFFACVLLPLLLMFAIYLKIFMAARRQLKQIGNKMAAASASAHGERSSSSSILQKEIHAAKSLAIIVGLFAVCWLPLHVINCYTLFCRGCARPPLWLMYVAILLSHANSVVNPLIYAYRIREFRQTFRKILRGHTLRETVPSRCQTASVHCGENGECGAIIVDSYDGILSKMGVDQNGFDGGANGDAGCHFYRNGALLARKEERFDEGLLTHCESSFTELEMSAFDHSNVS